MNLAFMVIWKTTTSAPNTLFSQTTFFGHSLIQIHFSDIHDVSGVVTYFSIDVANLITSLATTRGLAAWVCSLMADSKFHISE